MSFIHFLERREGMAWKYHKRFLEDMSVISFTVPVLQGMNPLRESYCLETEELKTFRFFDPSDIDESGLKSQSVHSTDY
jgi:hypothetical protein